MNRFSLFFVALFSIASYSQGVDDFDFTVTDQHSKNHNIAIMLKADMHVIVCITGIN